MAAHHTALAARPPHDCLPTMRCLEKLRLIVTKGIHSPTPGPLRAIVPIHLADFCSQAFCTVSSVVIDVKWSYFAPLAGKPPHFLNETRLALVDDRLSDPGVFTDLKHVALVFRPMCRPHAERSTLSDLEVHDTLQREIPMSFPKTIARVGELGTVHDRLV